MSEDHAALPVAAMPESGSEADTEFGAIRTALEETARGRWFLHEHARRTRSADTRLLLMAIDRLEEVIRAQQGEAKPPPAADAAALPAGASGAALAKADGAIESATAAIRVANDTLMDIVRHLRQARGDETVCIAIEASAQEIAQGCAAIEEAYRDLRGIHAVMAGFAADAPPDTPEPFIDIDLAMAAAIRDGAAADTPPPASSGPGAETSEPAFAAPPDDHDDFLLEPAREDRPGAGRRDPLAPVRALSEEEKLALFS